MPLLILARYYEPALGRFTSVDPMAEKYYSISPYAYCANNLINAVDLRGDTITAAFDGGKYTWGSVDGTSGFVGADGALYAGNDEFAKSLTDALNTLSSKSTGKELVDFLAGDAGNVQIRAPRPNRNEGNSAIGKGGVIWDSNSFDIAGMARPSFIGLGHELAHIQDAWAGTIDNRRWVNVGTDAIPRSEQYATFMENQIRKEHDLSQRTHYAYDMSSGSAVGVHSTRLFNNNGSSRFYQGMGQVTTIVEGLPRTITAPYKKKR